MIFILALTVLPQIVFADLHHSGDVADTAQETFSGVWRTVPPHEKAILGLLVTAVSVGIVATMLVGRSK
jgi:hypothetical protein